MCVLRCLVCVNRMLLLELINPELEQLEPNTTRCKLNTVRYL